MIRAAALTLALLALPGAAAAHCGAVQGSFSTSCESGVQVIRHNAPSAIPVGPSPAQVRLKIAKLQQATARERLATQRAIAAEQAELRRREIVQREYRNRILERETRGINRGFYGNTGFGFGGFQPGFIALNAPAAPMPATGTPGTPGPVARPVSAPRPAASRRGRVARTAPSRH